MKFIIIALFASVAIATATHQLNLTEEQRTRVRELALQCGEKEGITKEQIRSLRDGNLDNVDSKVQCFTQCFLEKLGFLANGAVQTDIIQQKLGPIAGEDKVKAIGEKCNGLTGTDSCNTAFKLYECYFKNNASYL